MKHFIHIITSIVILLSLSACEKDIDIDVDDAQIKPVVEAKLSNHAGDARVTLFYSQNLKDTASPSPIVDAQIKITDLDDNTFYYLTQESEGTYINPYLKGIVGHTYRIDILLPDGNTLSSQGTMPIVTALDDVTVELADDVFQDDEEEEDRYEITPNFIDTPNIENFYQLEIILNNKNKKGVNAFKDLGFDGLVNSQKVYIEAKAGDTVTVSLHNVNEPIYDYMYALANLINQGTGTPTNPISNIQGNALGYFKVYSYENKINVVLE